MKASNSVFLFLFFVVGGTTAAHLTQLAVSERPPSIPVSFLFGFGMGAASSTTRLLGDRDSRDSKESGTTAALKVEAAAAAAVERVEKALEDSSLSFSSRVLELDRQGRSTTESLQALHREIEGLKEVIKESPAAKADPLPRALVEPLLNSKHGAGF